MNRDDIIRMAIKCRLVTTGNRDGIYMDALMEFASLVEAAEREECARVCDDIERNKWEVLTGGGSMVGIGPMDCAKAIRARGEE